MTEVLFVCIGNSCRSQIAEGFAARYGSDIMHATSAGLLPAPIVQPQTVDVMAAKNIDISEQFPKSIHELELNTFDVIVNMSGAALPIGLQAPILKWDVVDPMGQPEAVYIQVRDQLEKLVMQLIMQLRRGNPPQVVRRPVTVPAAPKPKPSAKSSTPKPAEPQKFGFGRIRRARD